MSNDLNDLTGQQIGQFTALEEIGRGGMATVYRATQQSINRDVALKVLPRTFLHDPGFFERFEREVEVIASLEHPHIVPIYDYGEYNGIPYIAMRYLSGGSFRKLIAQGTPDLRDLVRPISQVAQALDHAHREGIIHRDLKPGNILLDGSDNAYLSDFGIARVLNSDLTGSAIIGTPSYMSPEQANGDPLDARADVYALGIVLFEMITGREPFQAATPIAMLLKQINERMPSITQFRDNIPESVDLVIAKATEKDRNKRFNSAGAMADAFEEAVRAIQGSVSLPLAASQSELPETATLPDITPDSGPPTSPIPSALDPNAATVTPATDDITRDKVSAAVKADVGGPATTFGTSPSGKFEKSKSRPPFAMIGIVAVLVALSAVGGMMLLNRPTNNAMIVDAVPIYADGVQVVDTGDYAIGVPAGLMRVEGSTAGWNLWRNEDRSVRFAVRVSEQALTLDEVVEGLEGDYANTTLIDTVESDNLIRRSFRVPATPVRPAGQLDLFIAQYGERVIAAQAFSTDEMADEAIPMLEDMLQSIRVPGV
jgi:serine/threonine protein kinase